MNRIRLRKIARGQLSPSPATLLRKRDGAEIRARVVYSIGQRALRDFRDLWRPSVFEGIRGLIKKGTDPEDWPMSLFWDWSTKIADAAKRRNCIACCVVADGQTQGFATLKLRERSRIRAERYLVYVEYLQVAPWNDRELFSPRYQWVGTALLTAAVRLSYKLGYRGRIGLHSLPTRQVFYEGSGLREVGSEIQEDEHIYFEMTAESAFQFVSRSK